MATRPFDEQVLDLADAVRPFPRREEPARCAVGEYEPVAKRRDFRPIGLHEALADLRERSELQTRGALGPVETLESRVCRPVVLRRDEPDRVRPRAATEVALEEHQERRLDVVVALLHQPRLEFRRRVDVEHELAMAIAGELGLDARQQRVDPAGIRDAHVRDVVQVVDDRQGPTPDEGRAAGVEHLRAEASIRLVDVDRAADERVERAHARRRSSP
jgi:hypothetical protein